jgi:type II secretory pathway pseudopilin PulG
MLIVIHKNIKQGTYMNKRISADQKGFAVLELGLVLVVVGIIAATGYFVISKNGKTNESLTNSNAVSETAKVAAPTANKQPAPVVGKTVSEVSKTSVDNVLSSLNEEAAIDEYQASQVTSDINGGTASATAIGDVNVNF